VGLNLLDSFEALFAPNKRLYWHFILSSMGIALIYLYIFKKERKVNLSKKLWLHKSAILDYKYFILSFFIKTLMIIPVVIGINEVILFTYELLEEQFGFVKVRLFSKAEVMMLFTLTLFVISDFTRYWLHRLLHIVPWLWEFHKVHHSAKVLTPITFYRVHPIENILFGFRYAFSVGIVSGVFMYLFGAYVGIVEIVGANAFLYIFALLGSNLRHSHIKVGYPVMIENFFISPYQHQLHHSVKYINKNFGGYLAVWDKIFGTLQYSRLAEKSKIGIETKSFESLTDILFVPFKKIMKQEGVKYVH